MTKYALLDYDGFVCKAFYASHDEGIEKAYEILNDLTECAERKAKEFFNTENITLIKSLSGHTFKKDIYPTYKLSRKRNEGLGLFRDLIKEWMKKELVIVPQLEADDVLVLTHLVNPDDSIIFSDDKDLRYYADRYCKINLTEKITDGEECQNIYYQMLAGDKEDSVDGLEKVGLKTAEKLINKEFSIDKVIKIYKDKGASIDDCVKNINLIMPINTLWNKDIEAVYDIAANVMNKTKPSDQSVMNAILGQCGFISEKAKEIYFGK